MPEWKSNTLQHRSQSHHISRPLCQLDDAIYGQVVKGTSNSEQSSNTPSTSHTPTAPTSHSRPPPHAVTHSPHTRSPSAKSARPSRKFGSIDNTILHTHYSVQYKNELACALGDVLHGAVELQLERSIDVDRMTVTFYGEVTYSFRGERHSRQFERQRQDLWRTPTTLGSRLQPGLYVYEFFVGTRTDLPSAFIAKSGSIHSLMYYCEIRITERYGRAPSAAVDHIKRRSINLRTQPIAMARLVATPNFYTNATDMHRSNTRVPVCQRNITYVKNLLDTSGCIVVTVLIANQQCRPGENLIYNVEILNCYRRLKVYASLVRIELIQRQKHEETVTTELYRVKLGSIGTSEHQREWLSQTLWIPSAGLAPLHPESMHANKRVIAMGTHFLLSVHAKMGKNIQVRIPLVIRESLVPCRMRFANGTRLSGAATL